MTHSLKKHSIRVEITRTRSPKARLGLDCIAMGPPPMARILIVDDEPPMRELLSRFVQAAGHEVAQADSAESALALCAANPPAVVFCDLHMPGRGGAWLVTELRKTLPTAALVLATGVSAVSPEISLRAGVVAYLLKPFNRAQVLKALNDGLDWHQQAVARGPSADLDRLEEWLDDLKK